MNKINKSIIAIIIVSLAIGFFFGYLYKGYEIKRNLEKFAEGIGDIFGEGLKNVNKGETRDDIDALLKQSDIEDRKKIEMYLPYMEIKVDVSEYESFMSSDNRFNGKARSLKGTIKNTGDQSVNKVRLLVKFLDKNGLAIYENDYNPLYNSDKYDSITLKPNYSNEFIFNTDGVPVEWSGKIEYKISDLVFGL